MKKKTKTKKMKKTNFWVTGLSAKAGPKLKVGTARLIF